MTPNVLTRAVAQIRKALGDEVEDARVIETVAKRGYRFIAPVTVAHAGAAPVAVPDAGLAPVTAPDTGVAPAIPPAPAPRAWSTAGS